MDQRPAATRWRTLASFLSCTRRYWLEVFPVTRSEVRRLRRSALSIPDPSLRGLALHAQRHKWASLEGAAAFAAFVPRSRRALVARLLVDLQAIFDYADTLMEQPCADPIANARQLHAAFLAAFHPNQPHLDYYRHHPCHDDGGYLIGMIESCRRALHALPSYRVVAPGVLRNSWRILFYQAAVSLAARGDHARLEGWTREQVSPQTDMEWWEIAAAAGSSLAVFALIAAAARPALEHRAADAIERLYWPWAESLHIFLDCLVDRAEDAATGQPNLLDHYTSAHHMASRLRALTAETFARAAHVEAHHRLILTGMVALYLSDEQAWTVFARPAAERILSAADSLVSPALLLLRVRRLVLS